MLALERAKEESIMGNPANFGFESPRQCICELPGQIACPGWKSLPKAMRGKWKKKLKLGEITPEDMLEDDQPQPSA